VIRNIVIKGAREHNLKNISVEIPRRQFVVVTGLSGSGKSSLAFDTIYAEGQRRYLESLSAYVRQFLEQLRKPEVDSIDGLSPSISIEQKNISKNPRSTVGTVTEIYDYLRLLYARAGTPHCYRCSKPIHSQSISQIVLQIMAQTSWDRFSILAPIARDKKGEYQKELASFRSKGFLKAHIDGADVNLSEPIKLKKQLKHEVSIYIDRLMHRKGIESRLTEAIELAESITEGLIEVHVTDFDGNQSRKFFSTRYACADCGISFQELEPRNFSFNSPYGACPACNGFGEIGRIDPELLISDPQLSLIDGAILPWETLDANKRNEWIKAISKHLEIDPNRSWKDLTQADRDKLLFSAPTPIQIRITKGKGGSYEADFEGLVPDLQRRLQEDADATTDLAGFTVYDSCTECQGSRLKQETNSVLIGGMSLGQLCQLSLPESLKFMTQLKLPTQQSLIAEGILKEIMARLGFLIDVGLGYLSLSRSARTLSGGEAQRVRLATQVGSHLVGVLYVLDEPSIGLHQRDNAKLIDTLKQLRDRGNSVIVVEHDHDTILAADFVLDLGPGAGRLGGEIVFSGTPKQLKKSATSLTGKYLCSQLRIEVPTERRKPSERTLTLHGVNKNNLRDVTVKFPLGLFIGVTGVSGSGKSSLIIDTLLPTLQKGILKGSLTSNYVQSVSGLEHLDKVIHVDQAPIGRTPRSNPATYTGLFSEIRTLFSNLPEAQARGYKPGRFSFNVAGGRCEACKGDGALKVTMHFLPNVFIPCETCNQKRFQSSTLEVRYRGKNISEVLSMTIEEALLFFERIPNLRTKLQILKEVGLGYLQLGQNAVTLSGGEAQRIKLTKELSKRSTGKTLYVLDEPTTGLHFDDIRRLLEIIHRLVEQGNTVIVIEHQLDVIKQADYVIELGPEGGEAGGKIVFEGTPEGLCRQPNSATGPYLKPLLTLDLASKTVHNKECEQH